MCNLVAQGHVTPETRIQRGSGKTSDRPRERTLGSDLLQDVQEPTGGGRASSRNRRAHAENKQVARILPGDDLRGLFGRSQPGRPKPRGSDAFVAQRLQIIAAGAAKPIPARDQEYAMPRLAPRQPRIRLDSGAYKALCREVLRRDSWRCQNCGTAENLQVHHIQSRSKLGHDSLENLDTIYVSRQ